MKTQKAMAAVLASRSERDHNWHLDADGVEVAKGQGEGVPDRSDNTNATPQILVDWQDLAISRYDRVQELLAQRDELVAALKQAAILLEPFIRKMNIRTNFSEINAFENTIRKTIAKCEASHLSTQAADNRSTLNKRIEHH